MTARSQQLALEATIASLRADLARVTGERDEACIRLDAARTRHAKELSRQRRMKAAKVQAAEAEAAMLRGALQAVYDTGIWTGPGELPTRDDFKLWRDMREATWERARLALSSSPRAEATAAVVEAARRMLAALNVRRSIKGGEIGWDENIHALAAGLRGLFDALRALDAGKGTK